MPASLDSTASPPMGTELPPPNRGTSMRHLLFFRSLHLATFLLAACSLVGMPMAARAQQGGVRVGITLNGESVEVIRAWRRAKGLDPPDAEADRRFAELVMRARAKHATRIDPPREAILTNSLVASTPPIPQLLASGTAERP
ncbi:hypothetical protein [Tahibacter sp.]|uniref:hypothetical protein n=1 Tax=Tahibacter sp. TaxID=2056211 RepID=UPI0028C382D2|nr:hypothetical protein [Tahibacter sp.]